MANRPPTVQTPNQASMNSSPSGGASPLKNWLEEGKKLLFPTLEFCYKEDRLNDPLINEYHIRGLQLAKDTEIEMIKKYAFQVNQILQKFFKSLIIDLIDFKLEFGRYKGEIILADEISPDTCRLWETGTGRKLDKDRFRADLGNIEEAYQEILSRVAGKN